MKGRSPYLRVSETYSETNNGKTKIKKRTIQNIGPLPRYDDGAPDYVDRLRKSFKDGSPLIKELTELSLRNPTKDIITIKFDRNNLDNCMSKPQNIGYFLLDGLYDALGIYDVLNLHKSRSKLAYDLNGLAKLLVFGRVLWPDSKCDTFESRDRYLFGATSSDELKEIYRTLDHLDAKSETIQKRMNLKISGGIGRNMEVCYYDVTNYYFEIGENDGDKQDAGGNILPGLRKKGVSKEKRGEPIVQMGLFIDDNGIPIAYHLFPGNNIDQTTLRPAMKRTVDRMDFGRVVVVADGGLNSDKNIGHVLDTGNGYIVSRSVKKSRGNVKQWMLDDTGYEWNEKKTFKVKSEIRKRTITKEDGAKMEITEKLVCYWSKKHCDRERHENKKFVEYLESVMANPDKLKDKQKKIEKYLVKKQVDKETDEIVDTKTHLSLDLAAIQEYFDLMGYYTLMTSEVDKPDREIISKYHGLSRIEDSFRITKSDLEGRPVYVRTREHINAHFLVCFIALTMIRLIQYRVLKHLNIGTKNERGWESGVTAARIKEALASFQADALPNGYFRTTKPNADMALILESMGVAADFRLPVASDLRKLKRDIDKAGVI
jgi:transposase